ncbi:MAG TPA: PEP-CTERM sorting domain-containing protein [Phycisphaerae bacterium]|nr:PEP-CTERM sorting domain-containing protein [Phycisphaerae bacterium]
MKTKLAVNSVKSAARFGMAALALFLCTAYAAAAQIKVQFDDNAGGKHNGAGGLGAIGDANRGDAQVFTSRGFAGGSLIKNSTSVAITDLHLELTSGDTFDPASTGGAAFPTTTISNGGKTIDFTGGNIAKGDFIWSQIPLSANFGGTGAYKGYATPQVPPPPPPPPKMAPTGTKTGTSTGMNYNSNTSTLSITTSSDAFATYNDGTTVTSNTANETIIGSQISLSGFQLLSSTPDSNGNFDLGDCILSITNGSTVFLDATLSNALLIPDHSVAGSDSLLQATLLFPSQQAGLNSQYLNEFFGNLGPGTQGVFNMRTSILGATSNLTISGSSTGNLVVGQSVPEPASVLMLAIGLSGAAAGIGRRKRVSA